MTDHEERFTQGHWEEVLESIDLEIAQLAIVCRVPLLEPGVAERVLQRDALVCGHDNAAAFGKLRALLLMHYAVTRQMRDELGAHDAASIAAHVRTHLAPRIGHQLERGAPDDAR